jgi:hypothetical protein
MKLSRMDGAPLLAIAIGGAIGVLAFPPQNFDEWAVTTRTTTVVTKEGFVAFEAIVSPEGIVQPEVGTAIVRVRIDASEPLVFVDGELVESADHLDPDDIERIEVLKGKAAIGLYGIRASGGVIQIFLKDGAGSDPGR